MSSSDDDPSVFLSNLFDPSLVDPSFTEATPTLVLLNNSNSGNDGPRYNNNGGNNNNDTLCSASPCKTTNDLQFHQELYFILVIATCSLTVFVALSFALYRLIEYTMTCASGSPSSQCGGGDATTATPTSAVAAPTTSNDHPSSSSVVVIEGGLGSSAAAPTTSSSSSSSSSSTSSSRPGYRTPSVEFLSEFFTASFPSFASGSSSSRSPKRSRRRPRDAPPPYDDPPPYHVAISMESMAEEEHAPVVRTIDNGITLRV